MATRAEQAAALDRRRGRFTARVEFFTEQVLRGVRLTAAQRVVVATQLVRDKVVINLSTPVTKTQQGNRTIVSDRSTRGQFPRADTTTLMKSIFAEVRGEVGRVGTPLDYGLILETRMDRSFLVRTFNEMRGQIVRILTRGGVGNFGITGGFGGANIAPRNLGGF